MEKLHARQQALDTELARPELYEDDAKAELLKLMEEKRSLDADLGDVEEAWMEAGEALEAVQAPS